MNTADENLQFIVALTRLHDLVQIGAGAEGLAFRIEQNDPHARVIVECFDGRAHTLHQAQ